MDQGGRGCDRSPPPMILSGVCTEYVPGTYGVRRRAVGGGVMLCVLFQVAPAAAGGNCVWRSGSAGGLRGAAYLSFGVPLLGLGSGGVSPPSPPVARAA